MQRNLRNAAIQFRDSVRRRGRPRRSAPCRSGPTTARDGASEQYSDRYEAWVETAEFPRHRRQTSSSSTRRMARLRVRRFDAGNATRSRAGPGRRRSRRWRSRVRAPAARLRRPSRSDAASRRFPDDETAGRQPAPQLIGPPPPGVADGRRSAGVRLHRRPARPRATCVSEVLPALARRFFIHSEGDSYRVAVVSMRDHPQT